MKLSDHEQRWLTELESRLIEEEPRLHRALATLRTRPLRGARIAAAVRATARNRSTRLVMSAAALAVGVAILVTGVVGGAPALALAGVVTAQFGPWLLVRRRHHRTSVRRPAARAAGGRPPTVIANPRPPF